MSHRTPGAGRSPWPTVLGLLTLSKSAPSAPGDATIVLPSCPFARRRANQLHAGLLHACGTKRDLGLLLQTGCLRLMQLATRMRSPVSVRAVSPLL